jgi:hypothetical protein
MARHRHKHLDSLQTRRAPRVETPRTDAPKVAAQGEGRRGVSAYPSGKIVWHDRFPDAKKSGNGWTAKNKIPVSEILGRGWPGIK